MSPTIKYVAWAAALYAAAVALPVAAGALLALGLSEADANALWHILELRWPALILAAIFLAFLCAIVVRWFFARYLSPIHVLAEQTRVIRGANADLRLSPDEARGLQELAAAINGLAEAYRDLRRDSEARAAEARARLEEERNRLAALMSELTQGVLVCNADGTILLYNERAHALFGAAENASPQALVGLGRSLFALVDRRQVAHAAQKLNRSLERGERLPSARFVAATPAGRLLKAQLAPFLNAEARLSGMVLTLEDVTDILERESQRRSLLQSMAASVRAPTANIRAVAENLAAFPEIDGQRRARFVDIIVSEARELSGRINDALRQYADALKATLMLEDMRVADLLEFARQRISDALGITADIGEVDEQLWVRVDSFAFVQAMLHLAARLHEEYGTRRVELHARTAEQFAEIDISWSGTIVGSDALSLWESQSMESGAERSPLTVRDVLEQHGGEVWYRSASVGGVRTGCFRFLMPRGEPGSMAERSRRVAESRPEYYDFDLFERRPIPGALTEARLASLSYTVFDTETTGLEPSAGDEIISIGAVRAVNGRLLRSEVFEQLVNPRRPLNPESTRVHGIDAAALEGQPTIGEVLPRFHGFCADTVLVAHNAAFDMRFLQLKQASTGVRFDQPVLDTLLLSAVAQPSLDDHRLEAIAERLGVSVIGRHTALGDALLTGEVFLKLLPLLAERGIVTLGQALEASRRTYYARLQY
jgi:DNA polymerase-3 subunit epsilon